ncbi:MAG: hypothetical protein U0354_00950 [Candidatus Sericytochromatia bacterium]
MAETKIFGVTVNTDVLTNMPDMYKIGIGSFLAATVLFIGGYYFVYPVYQEYQTLFEQNETLANENTSSETKLGYDPNSKKYKKIDEIDAEMLVLQDEIKVVQERIPSKENLPTLLYDLEKFVEVNNKSDLLDMTPSAMTSVVLPPSLQSSKPTGLDLKQIGIATSIESNYTSLISLFKDFERYQRAIANSNLSLTPIDAKNGSSALKVTLSLKAFVLPEGGK